jgi:hypothetical protein
MPLVDSDVVTIPRSKLDYLEQLQRDVQDVANRLKEFIDVDGTAVTGPADADRIAAEMRARVVDFRHRIATEGLSTEDAVHRLGVKAGETVRQRLAKKQLFGLKINRDYRFPQWQFDGSSPSGVLPGLSDVLSVASIGAFELAAWFETPLAELGDRTPVQALHDGEIAAVVSAARAIGV